MEGGIEREVSEIFKLRAESLTSYVASGITSVDYSRDLVKPEVYNAGINFW